MTPPRLAAIVAGCLALVACAGSRVDAPPCVSSIPYGDNAAAGRVTLINGIHLYAELYGSGPPLLILHGNGGSISSMSCQIAFFSASHRVIAVDSRGRGKSEDGNDAFTFEQQADDVAALLAHEQIDQADVLGHSDGGIIALEMGIRHPDRVRKIVAAAPNLRPDITALFPQVRAGMKADLAEVMAALERGDRSRDWERLRRQIEQDLDEPHISLEQVRSIGAPTLLIGAEDDVIRPEHYLEMSRNLQRGALFIVPGTTHGGLVTSGLFNTTAARFLDAPLTRPAAR